MKRVRQYKDHLPELSALLNMSYGKRIASNSLHASGFRQSSIPKAMLCEGDKEITDYPIMGEFHD